MTAVEVVGHALWWLGVFFIVYSVLINSSFFLLTLLALRDLAVHRRRLGFAGYDQLFGERSTRGVSVLMPAHNESAGIVASVQAMLSVRYPDFEVVVVDDGSSDDTAARVIEAFDMVEVPVVVEAGLVTEGAVQSTYLSRRGHQNLLLVRKDNGGKADALNAGINAASKELVCMVDADSLLDPESLLSVCRPFADDPDGVAATGGVIRVANGSTVRQGRVVDVGMPRRWLPRVQVVEYLRAFLVGRAGWSALEGLMVISGAFGVFRRDILLELGGMATDCIGEDAELVVRLHRWMGDTGRRMRVVFVSEPVAWTEVPEDRAVLRKQRRRWHRGLTEIFLRHWRMLLRPRYGVVGMVTMPWFLFFELLAPFLELFGLVYFVVAVSLLAAGQAGWVPPDLAHPQVLALLLLTSVVYAVLVTLAALLAEELAYPRYRGLPDLSRAVWAAVEENFGYRQLNAWWRVGGAVEAIRRTRQDWGDMQRRGFGP